MNPLDPALELAIRPSKGHGASLLAWRGQARDEAIELPASSLLRWTPATDTGRSCEELARLARRLLERGSARPDFVGDDAGLHAKWRATLDAPERAVLAAIVRALPPALHDGLGAWAAARALLDSLVDALVREAGIPPQIGGTGWESEIEKALTGTHDVPGRTATGPRALASLAAWHRVAKERETGRPRLVLRLEAPATSGASFRLSFHVEAKEGQSLLGPVPAAEVWADTPEAHVLGDELEPVRTFLREALHKAGQVVVPVEVSLASETPAAALLTSAEAWEVLDRLRPALEATGARVEIPAAFDGLESRFPRARVRLERGDGRDPDDASLATKYRVRWEVACGERIVDAEALRALGKQAPLALLDDTWVPLTHEAADRLARVAERSESDWTGPQALAAALAGEVRRTGDLSDAQVHAEAGLEKLIEALGKDPEPVAVPAGLKASLRAYQQRGLSWLVHRARHGLGALLADDMGLGKTVQLIALLVALEEEERRDGPTLVVCPASLVGNWERELAKFAPGLAVVRHHGGGRLRDAAALQASTGIVLTTYGLVRRDAATFAQVRWGTVVLDEAQNVKNATAAQSRAVRALDAVRRVALSGTPVENRLTEMWSLMEFLNPGLLGSLDRFRREIALPIEKDRDARAVRWLRAATAPFLLRRLKSDPEIAPELPEKELIRVYCSLSEEQAKLYAEAVDRSLGALDEAGSKIERSGRVLRLLTELKQICNHPAHFLGDEGPLNGRSGKLERAAEMLEEIVDGGEKALVFTQYVEMGELLAKHFSKRLKAEVPLFHGGLTLPKRETLVQRFQEAQGGPPAMIMSLRAGGVGLNLTRASHVLHYDRWWNPAVEDQATDRAHRIGQTRRVQVHVLVSMGTLEERIDRLLEEKRGLADAVVSGGEAWLGALSTDELRALVSLGSDAAVEAIEAWDDV